MLVTIQNLQSSTVVLPSGRSLRKSQSVSIPMTISELESSGLKSLQQAGLVSVTTADDPASSDAFEGANLSALSGIGVVSVDLSAEAANAITVTCQLQDLFGRVIEEQRQVFVRSIADTDAQGELGETMTPVGSVMNFKDDADGVASSAWIQTTSGGAFDFTVTDTLVESCAVLIQAEGCLSKVVKLTFV